MVKKFTSIPIDDLSRGIYSRGSNDLVPSGYSEDLINVVTNSEGFLEKRKGYAGYGGWMPIRITSVSRSGATLTFTTTSEYTLDPTSPLIIGGRILGNGAGTEGTIDGDFSNTAHTYKFYEESAITETNLTTITVADSSSGTYNATEVDMWMWGRRPSTSEITAGVHAVQALTRYKREGDDYLVAVKEGAAFKAVSPLAGITTNLLLESAITTTRTIGPAFVGPLDATTRTSGVVATTATASNLVEAKSATFTSGSSVDIVLDVTGYVLTGTLWSTTPGSGVFSPGQALTLSQFATTEHNGTWPITAVSYSAGPAELTVTVTNSSAAETDFDEINANGLGGVFTDVLDVTSASTSIRAGDLVHVDNDTVEYLVESLTATPNFVVLSDITTAVTVLDSSTLKATRTSNIFTAASVANLLVGDMLTAVGTGPLRVTDIVAATKEVTLDTNITISNNTSVTLGARWELIVVPGSNYTPLATQDNIQMFPSTGTIVVSAIADSLFFTSHAMETAKFDGAAIYRAGFIPWEPVVKVKYSAKSSKILAGNQATAASLSGSVYTAAAGTWAGFSSGDRVTNEDGTEFRIAGTPGTDTTITASAIKTTPYLDSSLGSGLGISGVSTFRYYTRLNLVDRNNNVIAGAATQSTDISVDVVGVIGASNPTSGGEVTLRFSGLPDWGVYDWDRVEVELYRTTANNTSEYFRIANKNLAKSEFTGYFDIVDTLDSTFLPQSFVESNYDPVNSSILGNEIGVGWTQPPRALHSTSISNRLVLADIKGYPELDITLRAPNGKAADLWHRTKLTFTRTNDGTATGTKGLDYLTFDGRDDENRQLRYAAASSIFDTNGLDPTYTGHMFFHNQPLIFDETLDIIKAGVTYYVQNDGASTYYGIALTPDGIPLDTTALAASGTFLRMRTPYNVGWEVTDAITATMLYIPSSGSTTITIIPTGEKDPPVGTKVVLKASFDGLAAMEAAGLSEDTTYYVVSASSTSIELSLTKGGTAITTTGTVSSDYPFMMEFRGTTIIRTAGAGSSNYEADAGGQWVHLYNMVFAKSYGDVYENKIDFGTALSGLYAVITGSGTNSEIAIRTHHDPGNQVLSVAGLHSSATTELKLKGQDIRVGDKIKFIGGSAPLGLSQYTDYYVIAVNEAVDTFTLHKPASATGEGATVFRFSVQRQTVGTDKPPASGTAFRGYNGVSHCVIAKDPTDIPIPAYHADISDWRFKDSAGDLVDRTDEIWSSRLSSAINTAQALIQDHVSNDDSTVWDGFKPWLNARSGGDYGTNRLVVTTPYLDSETLAMIATEINSNRDIFINGTKRTPGSAVISSETKIFPSRVVTSYKNYPEMFDTPYADSQLSSDSVIDINSSDGQKVTGMATFFGETTSGASQLSDILIVFKEASVYAVDLGDSVGNSAIAARVLNKLETAGQGCTIPGSVAATNKGIIFANASGLYRINRDFSMSYVGKSLEGKFASEYDSSNSGAVSALADPRNRRYLMSYADSNSTTANKVFVYDYTKEGAGQEFGAWARFDNYPATHFTEGPGFIPYFATADGQVMGIRSNGLVTDYRDDAAAIDTTILLSPTDFGDRAARKLAYGVMANFRADTDMDGTEIEAAIDISSNFQTAGMYSIDKFVTDGISDSTVSIIKSIRASLPQRRFRYIQLKFTNSTIDETVVLTSLTYSVALLTPLKGAIENS